MKTNRKVLTVLILVLTFSHLTGCIAKNESKAQYTIKKGYEITDTYYYQLEDGFKGMELEIDLKLNQGKVTFQLINPEGEVAWEELVEAGQDFKEKRKFQKIVGKWNLYFESIDESGQGDLKLKFNKL